MLAEKPLISEETDLLEPSLLDELICHISSLASVYHKPPSSFVAGKTPVRRAVVPARTEEAAPPSVETPSPVFDTTEPPVPAAAPPAPAGGDSLIGDLLSMDLGPSIAPTQPTPQVFQPQPVPQPAPPPSSGMYNRKF